jgi:hypothetical protein
MARLASALAPTFAVQPALHAASNGLAGSSSTAGAHVLGAGVGKTTTIVALALVCAAGGYGAWRSLQRTSIAPPQVAAPSVAQPERAPADDVPQSLAERAPAPDTHSIARAQAPAKSREPSRARPAEPSVPSDNPIAAPAPKQELSEWALVDLARRSVTTDPQRAIALAQEHHRRFGGGPLSEEADFIEIEATKRLGRLDDARALEEKFHKLYPMSIHGRTVQVRPAPSP